jgi:flagellar motor switch protein FliM
LRGPDGHARFDLGQTAIYDVIEALFGGDGSVAAYRERRPLTELEKAIGCALAPHFAEALGEATGRTGVIYERVADEEEGEDGPGSPDAVPLAIRMRLVGRDSRFVLHCPRRWLGFPDLSPTVSETGPEVDNVEIDLKISLVDHGRTLGELLGLAEGSVLPLNLPASAPARVEADGVRLFDAALGQSGGRYTICIERAPDGDAAAFGSNAA